MIPPPPLPPPTMQAKYLGLHTHNTNNTDNTCNANTNDTVLPTLQAKYLGLHTQKSEDEIMRDFSRPRYFNPYEAVGYGLIDTVSTRAGTAMTWTNVNFELVCVAMYYANVADSGNLRKEWEKGRGKSRQRRRDERVLSPSCIGPMHTRIATVGQAAP